MAAEWHAETHEDPGVRTGRILWLVLGFLGAVALLCGGLGVYYRSIRQDHALQVGIGNFPAPRLQPNPTQDYVSFHASQVQQLNLSGPADANSTLVRLPIDEAMAVVVARGAEAYDPVAGTPSASFSDVPTAGDMSPRASRNPDVAPYGMRQ